MADTNDFATTIVAGIQTPGSQEAQTAFEKLVELVGSFEDEAGQANTAVGALRTGVVDLVKKFGDGKKPLTEFKTELAGISLALKQISLFRAAQGALFDNSEVASANKLASAVQAAAKAFETLARNQALAEGRFGLDSATAKEARANQKLLATANNANEQALRGVGGREGKTRDALLAQRDVLAANNALLADYILKLDKQEQFAIDQLRLEKLNHAERLKNIAVEQAARDKAIQNELNRQRALSASRAQAETQAERDARVIETNRNIADQRKNAAILPGQERARLDAVGVNADSQVFQRLLRDPVLGPQSELSPRIGQLREQLNLTRALAVAEGREQIPDEQRLVELLTLHARIRKEISDQVRIERQETRDLATGIPSGLQTNREAAIRKAGAKAFREGLEAEEAAQGRLGLGANTKREAQRAQARLQDRIDSNAQLILEKGETEELVKQREILAKNGELLKIRIRDLNEIARLEHQNTVEARKQSEELQRNAASRERAEASAERTARLERTNRLQADSRANALGAPGVGEARASNVSGVGEDSLLRQARTAVGLDGVNRNLDSEVIRRTRIRDLQAETASIQARINTGEITANSTLDRREANLREILAIEKQIRDTRAQESITDPVRRQQQQLRRTQDLQDLSTGPANTALFGLQLKEFAKFAFIGGLVASLRQAVTFSIELEQAFQKLQAITGTTKTEMAGLEGVIRSVSNNAKVNATEVADAARLLAKAGLSIKEVADGLRPVIELATGTGVGVADAVDLVVSIVDAFNKKGGDVADLTNKLAQAANTSKISVEELADAFKAVGVTAGSLGITFEETTAALASIANAGVQSGSRIGTGLNQFISELSQPSARFKEILINLGLSISDLDVRSNGLIGVAEKLKAAGFQATDAIKAFDTRGATSFNALISDPEALRRQYEALLQTSAATEANAAQLDSLQSQAERLGNSFGNFVSVGLKPAQDAIKDLIGGLANVFDLLGRNTKVLQLFGTVFISAGIAAAVAFVGTVGRQLVGLGAAAVGLLPALTAAEIGTVSLTAAQGRLAVSAGAAAAAQEALAAAATASGAATAASAGGSAAAAGGASLLARSFLPLTAIVTAIILAYEGYKFVVGSAARETDRLKTESKAANDELLAANEVVTQVTEKIADLTGKQNSLGDSAQDLAKNQQQARTAALELTNSFGKFGLSIDENVTSLGEVNEKLREFLELRKGVRDDAISSVVEKLESEKKDAEGSQAILSRKFSRPTIEDPQTGFRSVGPAGALKDLLSTGALSQLNDRQLKVLEEISSKLSSGVAAGEIPQLGQLSTILGTLPSNFGKDNGNDELVAQIREAVRPLLDSRVNIGAISEGIRLAQTQQENNAQFEQFRAEFLSNSIGGGRSFETFLGDQALGNIAGNAKRRLSEDDKRDSLKVADVVRAEVVERQKLLAAVRNQVEAQIELKPQDEGLKKARNELNNAISSLTKQYTDQAGLAEPLLRRQSQRDLRELNKKQTLLEAQIADNVPGAVDAAKANAAKIRDLNIRQKNFELDPNSAEIADNVQGFELQFEDDKDRIEEKAEDALENAAVLALTRARAGVEAQINAAQARSAGTRRQASKNNSPDEVLRLQEEGLKFIDEEFALRRQALEQTIKQENVKNPGDRLAEQNRRDSLQVEFEQKRQDYQVSFEAVLLKSIDNFFKVTESLKSIKVRLDSARDAANERLFAADDNLRESKVEIAKAGTPQGQRNTSQSRVENLQRDQERLVIESNTRALAENDALQVEFNAALDQARRDSQRLAAAAKAAREKFEEFKKNNPTDQNSDEFIQLRLFDKSTNDASDNAAKQVTEILTRVRALRSEGDTLRGGIPDAANGELTFESLKRDLLDVKGIYQSVVEDINLNVVLTDGLSSVVKGFSSSLGEVFFKIASGAQSVKGAFKSLATSIVSDILKIITKMLALFAIQKLTGLLGFGGAAPSGTLNLSSAAPSFFAGALGAPALATGGIVQSNGSILRAAGGGIVTGGIRGKDSVPALVMPGEGILTTKAVDALGADFILSLNAGNNVVTQSANRSISSSISTSAGRSALREPHMTNVYVVSPDQKPAGLGPRDVIAVVNDDISRNGSIRKLIKQVASGG